MTNRITDSQTARRLLFQMSENRRNLDKYGNEISTGLKAIDPGDSTSASTISLLQQSVTRLDGYKNRISALTGEFTFQDDTLRQVNEVLTRAKEIATQAGNETNGAAARSQMAEEVWQIRDQMVQMANSKYQGRYAFGGAADDTPPFVQTLDYAVPASGAASQGYTYTTAPGATLARTVNITDDLSITANTPGSQVFLDSIQSLERLGRAMQGYATNPASGAPDGTGAAFVFPQDSALQTQAIADAMQALDSARTNDIMPERVAVGGKMQRIQGAESILDLTKSNASDALDKLQAADITDSATKLSLAQTALQASLTVSTRILNQSILDYL